MHVQHAEGEAKFWIVLARVEAVWRTDAATWDRLMANEFTVVVLEGQHGQRRKGLLLED